MSSITPRPGMTVEISMQGIEKSRLDAIESAEAQRKADEAERAAAEVMRKDDEAGRITAEQDRALEEYARELAENGRMLAEESRGKAEDQRAGDEQSRVDAEKGRSVAEANRANAENQRVAAETSRANAEAMRQSTFEINEANRQAAFDSAETHRASEWSEIKSDVESSVGSAVAAASAATDAANTAAEKSVRYDVVQALSNAQMAQSRENIDAAGTNDVNNLMSDLAAETRRAKEAEDNRIKKFYTSNMGAISIADSDDGAMRNMVIGGRCEQDADPSPDNPQEIKSVDGCTMSVSNADGTMAQEAVIPFTLRGIGDVRDELYVYDDGTGKLIQRIRHRAITKNDTFIRSRIFTDELFNFSVRSLLDLKPQHEGPCNILCNTFSRGNNQMFSVKNTVFSGGQNSDALYFCVEADVASTVDEFTAFISQRYIDVMYEISPIETLLTAEQVKALFDLRTYFGGTNIAFSSDNGVEPYINFDYACALDAFVEYVKQQQGDTRDMIYDMDDRLTQAEVTALEAAIDTQIMAAMMEV